MALLMGMDFKFYFSEPLSRSAELLTDQPCLSSLRTLPLGPVKSHRRRESSAKIVR